MRLIDADKLMENKFKNDISYNAFCNLVKRQPSIDAVPVKHGAWEYIGGYGYQFRCSECIMCVEHKTKYCPNCGTRMDGERKES